MKSRLIAMVACCAVTGSAFAMADLPGTNPPHMAMADLPGTNPPHVVMADLPGTNPPHVG